MIHSYIVIFLLVEWETIFSARLKFIIIIPSSCRPLLTKQKGGEMKWCYENVTGGKEIWAKTAMRLVFWKTSRHFKNIFWVKGYGSRSETKNIFGNVEESKNGKWEWTSILSSCIHVFPLLSRWLISRAPNKRIFVFPLLCVSEMEE